MSSKWGRWAASFLSLLDMHVAAFAHVSSCEGFSDACMTTYPRAPTAGVRKAPRNEIASGGATTVRLAGPGFERDAGADGEGWKVA